MILQQLPITVLRGIFLCRLHYRGTWVSSLTNVLIKACGIGNVVRKSKYIIIGSRFASMTCHE